MILFRSIWNNCIFFTRDNDNNGNNRGLFNKFEKNLGNSLGYNLWTTLFDCDSDRDTGSHIP